MKKKINRTHTELKANESTFADDMRNAMDDLSRHASEQKLKFDAAIARRMPADPRRLIDTTPRPQC